MKYPKSPLAQSIIAILKAHDIKHIVISPGSRSAPLTLGFTNQDFFNCYSIVDERCASFFALGMAQQTQKPVVLVCTSGSALLNYYPAFAEAFYSQIPLIVIAADRPATKIDIGDGQTIRQENVFANHSLFNANLSEDASPENDFKIKQAIVFALQKKGPVHINVPFEEPLYEMIDTPSIAIPTVNFKIDKPSFDITKLRPFQSIWNNSKKILILVGANHSNVLSDAMCLKLAQNPAVVLLTETISNIHHEHYITGIDTLITPFSEAEAADFSPELLITFGGMVVSKRIKSLLRKNPPQQHWHIDVLRAYDTFGCLTQHFEMEPELFFNQFLNTATTVRSTYFEKYYNLFKTRIAKREIYLSQIPFSDFSVFNAILKSLPKGILLQISNSSAIRYVQLFPVDKSIAVFCNRGTSGIDGSTSTAIGAATVNKKQTVLITGDIGFFYDSNALWNNYIPKNFKIILLNNGGGGIFRILPGHEEKPTFNTYFETEHQLTAEHLAKMFQMNYLVANDEKSLEKGLKDLYQNDAAPTILEIFTPTKINNGILLDYFKAIK